MIIDHDDRRYRDRWERLGVNKYNGAFYYSKEIVKNIIPRVETDRNWITVNVKGAGADHSIVFIHNNVNPDNYEWLKTYGYKDLILVCGVPQTCELVKHLGTPIYLPLSVDVEYVKQFRAEKTRETAFAGRMIKGGQLPAGVDYICHLPREQFLKEMAKYKRVYAVDRCAIEAMILGCDVLKYDLKNNGERIIDNAEAAVMLQEELDRIDGKGIRETIL